MHYEVAVEGTVLNQVAALRVPEVYPSHLRKGFFHSAEGIQYRYMKRNGAQEKSIALWSSQ